ncbi:MAG TPA: Shedu immune nuclease family protein [Actinomycetes bacterium]|nr:Shedu immune nuclease family protein [Actinomycetes bacterium]
MVADLLSHTDARSLVEAAQLRLRREALARFSRIVQDPHSEEQHLQQWLQANPWIFGGRYVNLATHRRLVPGTEYDLPLIRPDGVLHLVEIKRACAKIVTHQRGQLVPNNEIHRAVAQAMNYLVGLDENRQKVRETFGIEARRATATVLAGHSAFQGKHTAEIREALRVYNSHLTRIDVIIYDDLLESACRSLKIVTANGTSNSA